MNQEEIRILFENSINKSPTLRDNTSLNAMEINGQFSHYMTPDTDTLWIGFQAGFKTAERLIKFLS